LTHESYAMAFEMNAECGCKLHICVHVSAFLTERAVERHAVHFASTATERVNYCLAMTS